LLIAGRDVLEFPRLRQRPPADDEDLAVELEADRIGVALTCWRDRGQAGQALRLQIDHLFLGKHGLHSERDRR
jgi:hypothetical protein